jgi:hypothetical protein
MIQVLGIRKSYVKIDWWAQTSTNGEKHILSFHTSSWKISYKVATRTPNLQSRVLSKWSLGVKKNGVHLFWRCVFKYSVIYPHGKNVFAWRRFAPGFVSYKKGCIRLAAQVIKFTSCLPMVGGSLQVLRLLPSQKLAAMIKKNGVHLFWRCVFKYSVIYPHGKNVFAYVTGLGHF